MPGGRGGPPLTRWLAGFMPNPPAGVLAFLEPCPEVGLEDLPCHKQLFWGLPPQPMLSSLLWELEQFVGAETMKAHRADAIEEILVKGGPQMLLKILSQVTQREGYEKLALQALWLLQALAAESPTQRWAGTMNESVNAAMQLTFRLCGGYSNSDHPHLLAAILSFLASCASRCVICCEESSAGTAKWKLMLQLINAALASLEASRSKEGKAGKEGKEGKEGKDAQAAAEAACHMVAQVSSHRPLGVVPEHQELYVKLLGLFSAAVEHEIVTEAAAEALLHITLRSNELKLEILRLIGHFGFEHALCDALRKCTKLSVKEKILMFLRSISAAQPAKAVVEAFPGQDAGPGIIEVIIETLQSEDPSIQRWGLAALGAICSADEDFAWRGAESGAASAVIWALSAETLAQAKSLEQDALFCAFSLLQTDPSRLVSLLSHKLGRLPGLTASAVARGLRDEGGSSEAAMWGLRIYERICQQHAFLVEPYVGVILDAILAEGCLHGTMIAGSNAVSHLASVCPGAREKLINNYVKMVKALQSMGHRAACEGTEDGRQREQELTDWVQVLVDIIGPPRPVKSDDQIQCEQIRDEEAEEMSKSVSKSKSNQGSKSNAGTKSHNGTKLESASRPGTKLGTKESSGVSRTKSKLQDKTDVF